MAENNPAENQAAKMEHGAEVAQQPQGQESLLNLGETYEQAAERQPEEVRAQGKKEGEVGGARLARMIEMGKKEGLQVS